jgi:3-methyladenine DNA glycosylase AlkD
MEAREKNLTSQLFALQDLSYREFQCRLMPTVEPETVIGVRTPALRKLAKAFAKTEESEVFLKTLPHWYYEEDVLHGILLSSWKDYGRTVEELDRFLPYVDNWAVCDLISPQAFRAHPTDLPERAKGWMEAEHPYTVRFGIGVLMQFYLDESFNPVYMDWVAVLRSGEYYVNMMIAWYFATALAKQYDAAISFLENRRLYTWVHNKTIQKAVESYRVTDERKSYLRTLRRKGEG